ncbi:gliding motility-associated C-terminal domain-containing protein [Bacteroidota bacterium]
MRIWIYDLIVGAIRFFFVSCFLFTANFVYAADYYWVGGSGNWSDINHWVTTSGGTINHITVPSPYDNVIFDANSFTGFGQVVNMNLNIITCKNFNSSNIFYSPGFNSNNATKVEVYGSFLMNSTVNYNISSKIHFLATSSGNVIDMKGNKFKNDIYFDGVNGSWSLQDSLIISNNNIFFINGTLNTNSHQIKCSYFLSNYINQRNLILGNSKIYVAQNWTVNTQNLNLNSGTSSIYIAYKYGQFNSTNISPVNYHNVFFTDTSGFVIFNNNTSTFNRVVFRANGTITGDNAYNDLVLSKGKEYKISTLSTQVFIDSLIAKGECLLPIKIFCDGSYATFNKTGGNITVDYVKLKNIHASGSAIFNAQNSNDLGNNTGWLINPPASQNLYWVNGSGFWTDTAHWSYSSGGPSGACPPTFADNVFFDNNSFLSTNDTVKLNELHSECQDMNWTAGAYNPVFKGASSNLLHIYGSLQLQSNMDFLMDGITFFEATTTGKTILTAGNHFKMHVEFRGIGGGWTLLDSLVIDDHILSLVNGHLNTNSQNVGCYIFQSDTTSSRTLTLGSSKIDIFCPSTIPKAVNIDGTNLSLNSGTSLFNMVYSSSKFFVNWGTNLVFYDVTFEGYSGRSEFIKDGSSFNIVKFNSDGYIEGPSIIDSLWLHKGNKYELYQNNLQTVNQLIAIGNCYDPIILSSDSSDIAAGLYSNSSTINIYDVILRDIHCSGNATFNAFNTVDLGNNTGWNIFHRNGLNLYWVNGQGNWSDDSHWSTSSGGQGGACIPSPLDNVFFDNNSFTMNNEKVIIDCQIAMCHDMNWINTIYKPELSGSAMKDINIWGSLLLSTNMNNQFYGQIVFEADTLGKTITSNGNSYQGNILFVNHDGGWKITDSLIISRDTCALGFLTGQLNTNGQFIKVPRFMSPYPYNRILNMEKSEFELFSNMKVNWFLNGDSIQLFADSSLLRITSYDNKLFNYYGDTLKYFNVIFEKPSSVSYLYSNQLVCDFNRVIFKGSGIIMGDNHYDTLVFSPGMSYTLESQKTQGIGGLVANGSCYSIIDISSSTNINPALIHKTSDTLEISYINLKGISGQGGAIFNANNSYDLGNNNNFNISAVSPLDLYWVNGTGVWHDSTHWSYSSGGPGGACIPTSIDDVFFDANSFVSTGNTVQISVPATCHNMDWTAAYGNPVFTGTTHLDIYGSLNFINNMSYQFSGNIDFKSGNTGNTINSAGHIFPGNISFNGNGGWALLNKIHTPTTIRFIKGSLYTSGNTIVCDTFDSDYNNNRLLSLDSSYISIKSSFFYAWNVNGINMTILPGTSLIEFINSGSMYNHNGNNLDYYNVFFTNPIGTTYLNSHNTKCNFNHVKIYNDGKIYGENTYDSLTFYPDNTYKLSVNYPQRIINYLWVRGNNCFPLRLESLTDGVQAEVIQTTGIVSGDFIHMKDIKASGAATFYAGANSSDISNNTGWIFNNSPTYVYGLGADTFLTKGIPITINTVNFNGGPGTSYIWSTGSTAPNLIVSDPGMYYVTVTYANNCVVVDSIYVGCKLQLNFAVTDASCPGYQDGAVTLTVSGSPSNYNYLWSTGDITPHLTNVFAGTYTVTVSDSVCDGIDTVTVNEPVQPYVDIHDTSFCEGTFIILDAGAGYTSYLWHDSSTSQSIILYQPDSVSLIVTDSNGCFSSKMEAYISVDSLPILYLGNDSCISFDGIITLNPGEFDAYFWSDGSDFQSNTIYNPGIYWLTIRKATCFVTDTIELISCPPEIIIPNVFTPNSDGFNDEFKPSSKNIVYYQLRIFNRWGKMIFQTNDISMGWNGKINNNDCTEGTYFFTIEYQEFGNNTAVKTTQGSVTLLR